jgi:hypothetical protein
MNTAAESLLQYFAESTAISVLKSNGFEPG